MALIWGDSTKKQPDAWTPLDRQEDAGAWLPDPPQRNVAYARRVQGVIHCILALTIFGTVIPADLYLANGFFGDPIHALRDPMVINSLVTISAALAVPVIPLALLAIFLHRQRMARVQRTEIGDPFLTHRQRQEWAD